MADIFNFNLKYVYVDPAVVAWNVEAPTRIQLKLRFLHLMIQSSMRQKIVRSEEKGTNYVGMPNGVCYMCI